MKQKNTGVEESSQGHRAKPPPLQGLTMVGHAKRQMRADAEGGAADGGADEHLVTA